MPLYHFDLVNTKTILDEGGAELQDDVEAMDSADMIARRILSAKPNLKDRHHFILVTKRGWRGDLSAAARGYSLNEHPRERAQR